ncbi:MAG: hypothetical protein AAB393_17760 [Bacteroidota bacterium]
MRHSILLFVLLATALFLFGSCKTLVFGSSDYESVAQARAAEQTSYEDSAKVFFATFPNPYPDKEFLWFAVFAEGAVEMRVHDFESDSVQSIYRFAKQEAPVHTIAVHQDKTHLVKCVLIVEGRMKCAKLYPALFPIQIPQFKTQYTVEHR